VPDTLDQSQTVANIAVPDPANNVDNGRTYWAQTFTAGLSGPLDRVQLVCTSTSNASITVYLTDTNSNTKMPMDILTQTTATCSTSGGFNDFVFSSPYSVTAGTVYALMMPWSSAYTFDGATNDLSPAGAAYDRNIYSAWDSANLGAFDFAFNTYVETSTAPTPSPTVSSTPPPTGTVPANNAGGAPGILLVFAGLAAAAAFMTMRRYGLGRR
jgi:hypothetical protein